MRALWSLLATTSPHEGLGVGGSSLAAAAAAPPTATPNTPRRDHRPPRLRAPNPRRLPLRLDQGPVGAQGRLVRNDLDRLRLPARPTPRGRHAARRRSSPSRAVPDTEARAPLPPTRNLFGRLLEDARPSPCRHARNRAVRTAQVPRPEPRPRPRLAHHGPVRTQARPALHLLPHHARRPTTSTPCAARSASARIALYGDSFGTFLGQSYAFRHPDTLRALVLDSAYPARGESAWYPSIPRTGIRSYVISCQRSPSCPPHRPPAARPPHPLPAPEPLRRRPAARRPRWRRLRPARRRTCTSTVPAAR